MSGEDTFITKIEDEITDHPVEPIRSRNITIALDVEDRYKLQRLAGDRQTHTEALGRRYLLEGISRDLEAKTPKTDIDRLYILRAKLRERKELARRFTETKNLAQQFGTDAELESVDQLGQRLRITGLASNVHPGKLEKLLDFVTREKRVTWRDARRHVRLTTEVFEKIVEEAHDADLLLIEQGDRTRFLVPVGVESIL